MTRVQPAGFLPRKCTHFAIQVALLVVGIFDLPSIQKYLVLGIVSYCSGMTWCMFCCCEARCTNDRSNENQFFGGVWFLYVDIFGNALHAVAMLARPV